MPLPVTPCAVCGEPTRSAYGVCRRGSPDCAHEHNRRCKEGGLIEYQPCDICGRMTRDKLGVCSSTKECMAERPRRLYAANKEAERARSRDRRPQIRESSRKRYAANPQVREYVKSWLDAHPGRISEYNRKRRQRPDRPCRYVKTGCIELALVGIDTCLEHNRQDNRRYHRQRRDNTVSALIADQQGICPWCWSVLPAEPAHAHIDHIIPRAHGGPDEPWNLQAMHGVCNMSKNHALTPQALALAAEYGVTLTG
jgi:hypothetical protein